MDYKELLQKIVSQTGPCMRLCSYCPEEYDTADVKECIENMVRKMYLLKAEVDEYDEMFSKLTSLYEKETGKKVTKELLNEDTETEC